MQSVTFERIPFADVRRGMTIWHPRRNRPVRVEWIGTTKAGHRRIKTEGVTVTVRRVDSVVAIRDRAPR